MRRTKTGRGQVLIRYPSPSDLPRHDRFDPDLLTGEIPVTLRAETLVFVPDGNSQQGDGPHFLWGADGSLQIPGSIIRGMVRENMQILGFGAVRPGEDVADDQIFFRDMTSARGSVAGSLKQYYNEALGIRSIRNWDRRSVTVPENDGQGFRPTAFRGCLLPHNFGH